MVLLLLLFDNVLSECKEREETQLTLHRPYTIATCDQVRTTKSNA